MQPTVYASYQNAEQAELMLGTLLEAGVAPEDLSLIISRGQDLAIEGGEPHLEESHAGFAMVDSGESGVPTIGNPREETYGSYTLEAPVGGGISTSSVEDSVSGVEEMDDSQSAAEDMSYPASAASYSSNERFDVAQGANTGFFNTTAPGPEGLGTSSDIDSGLLPEEEGVTSMIVPGVGLVIGDGGLATDLIGAGIATERGGNPAADMRQYLQDENVPSHLAFRLASDFEEGGAIIAVATPPGGMDFDILLDVFTKNGARNVELVEATD